MTHKHPYRMEPEEYQLRGLLTEAREHLVRLQQIMVERLRRDELDEEFATIGAVIDVLEER